MPERFRFGATYQGFRGHLTRSRSDLEFVREWQTQHLRNLLQVAVQNSVHYRALADKIGLNNSDIERFQPTDICKLPILSKEQLRDNGHDFLTQSPKSLDLVSTSGSSGVPLTFYLEKDRSVKEWAFLMDSWSRIGYRPEHRRGVFRGLHLSNVDKQPWEFERALGELRLSPFHLTDDRMELFCNLIIRYRIKYLHGYPSALTIFAGYVLRHRRRDVSERIEGIITASEALFQHQRELLSVAFETDRILSFYGQSEKVLFGSEVPGEPGVFEMEPLYGLPEIVNDNGMPLTEKGARGRLVGTGLLYQGMPFIRYDTGDQAELVEPASENNFFRMKLRGITSRWGREFLVGADGQLISMTAINIHSHAYGIISAFQFYQDTRGKATLRAVLLPGACKDGLGDFIKEISSKIGASVVFETDILDEIPKNTRGKAKFIDQRLKIDDQLGG
jgi:phenylacetate-CoA ligase